MTTKRSSREIAEIQVECPKCHAEFAVGQVLAERLRSEIQGELASEHQSKEREYEATITQIKKERAKDINDAKQGGIKEGLEAAKLEKADLENQVGELNDRVKGLESQELDLRKRERELVAKSKSVDLEISRLREEQETELRTSIAEELAEGHNTELKKRDILVNQLKGQIDDLKRKAEQGSQQIQGDAAELTLEERLKKAFPKDRVARTGKGKPGADVLHYVTDARGNEKGLIYLESKDAKTWQSSWLEKMHKDCSAHGAHIGIIVSTALPKDVKGVGISEGIWVTEPGRVELIMLPLREMLMQLHESRLALVGQGDKQSEMYVYFTSAEFKTNVLTPLKALSDIGHDIEKEKRAMAAMWKSRGRQVEKGITGLMELIGTVRGIAGREEVPEFEVMDTLELEASSDLSALQAGSDSSLEVAMPSEPEA